jgi:hypothetical protein
MQGARVRGQQMSRGIKAGQRIGPAPRSCTYPRTRKSRDARPISDGIGRPTARRARSWRIRRAAQATVRDLLSCRLGTSAPALRSCQTRSAAKCCVSSNREEIVVALGADALPANAGCACCECEAGEGPAQSLPPLCQTAQRTRRPAACVAGRPRESERGAPRLAVHCACASSSGGADRSGDRASGLRVLDCRSYANCVSVA